MAEFLKEPFVNLRYLVYLVDRIQFALHSLGYNEDTFVRWVMKRCFYIFYLKLAVLYKAMH